VCDNRLMKRHPFLHPLLHPSLFRWILCLSPGVVAFFVAALVSLWVPPYPNLHDDFGNLLVADTLWHGRVSNPTPPSHELLQTFHVVVEPTYAAKFPIRYGRGARAGETSVRRVAHGHVARRRLGLLFDHLDAPRRSSQAMGMDVWHVYGTASDVANRMVSRVHQWMVSNRGHGVRDRWHASHEPIQRG